LGRVRGEQRFVLVRAHALARAGEFAVADIDHHRLAPVVALENAQRLADHRREFAVGDQHRALAVVQLPGQERRVQPRVERVEHGIERRHRVVRFHHLRRVGEHGAHRAVAADAQRAKRRSQARAALARLRPGVGTRAVHHRRQVAKDLGAALDKADRAQGHEIGGVLLQALFVEAAHVLAPKA
jgi:hypothetical protein